MQKTKSIKVYKDTYDKLIEHKEKTGVTITFVVDKALKEYFDRNASKSK